MPSDSLTCNFTISTALDVGVSFQSDDGNANHGGQITIFTPGTAGPVTTQLWDNDGNVFFTIYSLSTANNCTVNSGSVPGSWTPYIEASESGLSCTIGPAVQVGENTYDIALTIGLSADTAASEE